MRGKERTLEYSILYACGGMVKGFSSGLRPLLVSRCAELVDRCTLLVLQADNICTLGSWAVYFLTGRLSGAASAAAAWYVVLFIVLSLHSSPAKLASESLQVFVLGPLPSSPSTSNPLPSASSSASPSPTSASSPVLFVVLCVLLFSFLVQSSSLESAAPLCDVLVVVVRCGRCAVDCATFAPFPVRTLSEACQNKASMMSPLSDAPAAARRPHQRPSRVEEGEHAPGAPPLRRATGACDSTLLLGA